MQRFARTQSCAVNVRVAAHFVPNTSEFLYVLNDMIAESFELLMCG